MSANCSEGVLLRALLEFQNYIQSSASPADQASVMEQRWGCHPGMLDGNSTDGLSMGLMNGTTLSEIFAAYNCSYGIDEGDEESPCSNPQFYSYTYRIIGTIFQGIVLLVGVLGNSMVVYVVARTKSMHSPTNCYLVSLAIADCIVLIAAVPQEILSYYLVGNQWIWGEYGCAAFIFFQNLGINASSLSLTAFTVERYIAICHPMKAQSVCTVSRAKRIIGFVWVFAVIYCSPWLFALTTTKKLNYYGFKDVMGCTFKLTREQYLGYYFADLFVFYVVPLLLSTVLYSLIARILFDSHRAKSSSSNKNNCPPPLSVDSTKTNAARAQVVKMLVLVVVIFAVLWLPYRGMLVYNSFMPFFKRQGYTDLWFLMLAKTCVYINSAINPILYNAMSVKFRRAFNRALTCGKSQRFYSNRWPHCRTNTSYATTASTTILPSSTTLTYNFGTAKRGTSPLCPSSNSPSQNIRLSHLSLSTTGSRVDVPAVLSPQAFKKSNSYSYVNPVNVIVDSDIIQPCHDEEDEDITQL